MRLARRLVICLSLVLLLSNAGRPAFAEEQVDLTPLMKPLCEKHAAPGALAAIVRDGKIAGTGACGVRRLPDDAGAPGEPAAIGDVSLIGSCGKAVTRLLMARLADQGKLSFDATLEQLLPDAKMREEYRGVTLAQVMQHRGGIQPYTEIGPRLTPFLFSLSGAPREQRAAFVAHLLQEAPAAKPGTREIYSNAGFCLLGHIAERAAGLAFEDLAPREVFAPLRMKESYVGRPSLRADRPHFVGHRRGTDGYTPARDFESLPVMAPAGMMTCSIADFGRLAGALALVESGSPGDFIKPASAGQIAELTPGGFEEGVPFFGGDGQYTAAFALWPSRKLAIVVETNAGDNDAVCAAILEAIRAKCEPQARPVPQEHGPGEPPKGPRLGITLRATDPEHVSIDSVEPGSVADKAGLKPGDRLVSIDGVTMADIPQEKLRDALSGKRIVFKVERDGKMIDVSVTRPE